MGEDPFDRLVSPHGFDGTGPVPDEVTKATRRSAMLRVKFLTTESGLNTREIEELFHALALTAEWLREVTEVRDSAPCSRLGVPACKKGTPGVFCEAAASCPCDGAADSEAAAQRYLREYEDEVRELSGQLEKLRAERAAYLYALRTADAAMGAALRGWSKQSADALFHAGLVIREATRHSDDGGELIRGRLYDLVQTEDDYEAFCRSCDWHVLGVETLESAAHLADLHVGNEHFDV